MSYQKFVQEETTMLKKISILTLLISVFGLAVYGDHVMSGSDKAITFKVRIDNISTPDILKSMSGQTAPVGLSPGVFVIYAGKENPVFIPGHKDHGVGLEMQAEDGNPAKLMEAMSKDNHVVKSGVFNTPIGSDSPGPIGPGASYEFSFAASPGQKLAYTQMFGQSNDLFYAPGKEGIALFDDKGAPVKGDITSQIILWDAGTEVNQEPGFGPDQGPRQKAPNTGQSESNPIGTVKDNFTYPQVNKVMKVTITAQ
jgi:hypothetical protein